MRNKQKRDLRSRFCLLQGAQNDRIASEAHFQLQMLEGVMSDCIQGSNSNLEITEDQRAFCFGFGTFLFLAGGVFFFGNIANFFDSSATYFNACKRYGHVINCFVWPPSFSLINLSFLCFGGAVMYCGIGLKTIAKGNTSFFTKKHNLLGDMTEYKNLFSLIVLYDLFAVLFFIADCLVRRNFSGGAASALFFSFCAVFLFLGITSSLEKKIAHK